MIQAGGGLIGTVTAAGVIAIAGKTAGLFDTARDFEWGRFAEVALALVGGIVGVIVGFISLFDLGSP